MKRICVSLIAIFIGIYAVFTLRRPIAAEVPVLLYHHILPDSENRLFRDNPYVVSLENFTMQMQYLYDNGFNTITLDELESFLVYGTELPPKSVMIHFDDGYYSNFVYAYPVLRDFGFNAIVFMITQHVEELKDVQPPLDHNELTWTAAKTMIKAADVFETASHSHSKHDFASDGFSTILYMASREEIISDTLRSFDFVSNHRAYAYPLGQYNQQIVEALLEAGITMAFTIQEGYITRDSALMELERFTVFHDSSMERFSNIVNNRRLFRIRRWIASYLN